MPLQYITHTTAGTRPRMQSPVSFGFDWTPPATNAGNIVLYVAAVAANGDNSSRGDHAYTARYTVHPPGVVNGASFEQDVSAGSWITILGANLATTTRAWAASDFNGGVLPTQLDG